MRIDCAWMRSREASVVSTVSERGAASPPGAARSARSDSSEKPRMEASGVRSSWLASATKRRIRSSLRWRASSDSPTWSSSVLRAWPTRPISVCSSVSSSGTRSVMETAPSDSGRAATRVAVSATARSGFRPARITNAIAAASSRSPPAVTSAMVVSVSPIVLRTSETGRPASAKKLSPRTGTTR